MENHSEQPLICDELTGIFEKAKIAGERDLINFDLISKKVERFKHLVSATRTLAESFDKHLDSVQQGASSASEFLVSCEAIISDGRKINSEILQLQEWFESLHKFLQIPEKEGGS